MVVALSLVRALECLSGACCDVACLCGGGGGEGGGSGRRGGGGEEGEGEGGRRGREGEGGSWEMEIKERRGLMLNLFFLCQL